MSSLKVGIIGLGVGERHIAGYRSHPAAEVAVVCDTDPARLAEVVGRHPGLRGTTDPDEVLEDPTLGAVSIASYDDFHHPQIISALSRGKHVFVEKPVCLYEEEAADIRRHLRDRPGLRLSSNLILRLSPRFARLHERIRAGDLGELFYVEGDYVYGRLTKITDGWRAQRPFYSVVLGGAVHMVDLLLWLTGDRVIEVTAYANRIGAAGTAFRYPDLVAALLRFESGLVGKVTANFASVHPHFHKVELYGTRATFVNDLGSARFFDQRDPVREWKPVDDAYPGVDKGDMIFGFVDAITRGGDPLVTEDEVFDTMAVCFAIQRSVETGRPERVRSL